MLRLAYLLPLLVFTLPAAAFAADPQMYKWTDSHGTVHYSDQPPTQPAPDLVASDMPTFPPVDQAKVAQQQAELLAQVVALQQLTQAQMAQQAQAAAIAQQQAESLAADAAAQQAAQAQPSSAEPIYISSAFVPRAYRANLYLPASHRMNPRAPVPRALHGQSISLLAKP